ncbi:hypothetical protein Atai01_23500 [Amycolatopsis taiwanensis]|uniref:Transposase n=1 Tax=Amycolatopsis taiwanensis TaxID=342230 RepID=A0A9W6QZG1_9PSEU|nr:hypothetical protein [Amycolatopsis taiwanensis]GLY65731.1 hypothetical protein Atai01_23500 [Amycolatopsis taiwanensis]
MSKDLNTLLTALYVLIDDHVVPPRTGRGRRAGLTDSELLWLAVAQVLLGYHSDPQWRNMFPACRNNPATTSG